MLAHLVGDSLVTEGCTGWIDVVAGFSPRSFALVESAGKARDYKLGVGESRDRSPGFLLGTHKGCRIGPVRVAELALRANFKRVDRARYQTLNSDGRPDPSDHFARP